MHWECINQDITVMDKRYPGKWCPSMLADNFWTVVRNNTFIEHKRKDTNRSRRGTS